MKYTRSHLRPRRSSKQNFKRAKLKRGSPKWCYLQDGFSIEEIQGLGSIIKEPAFNKVKEDELV